MPPTGGLLLAGPPGSGKTTLLRSLVQKLCEGDALVSVIDERGELMACEAAVCPAQRRFGAMSTPAAPRPRVLPWRCAA